MKNRRRSLLVEDDPTSQVLIEKALIELGHGVETHHSAESAWDAYCHNQFPLVILDWNLPGISGIELCRRIRRREKSRYTSILMLTARDSTSNLSEALEAGADDYLPKPFNYKHLLLRLGVVENSLRQRITRQLSEETRQQAEASIRQQIHLDPLTNTLNRQSILNLANQEFNRSRLYKLPFGISIINIASFRNLNIKNGSQACDEMLTNVGRGIINSIRGCDYIGRLGADEFLLLRPNIQHKQLIADAQKITTPNSRSNEDSIPAELMPTLYCGNAHNSTNVVSFDELLQQAQQDLIQNHPSL